MNKLRNVLFLCTGNSARSVMAECLLARHGRGRFAAFSAGSHPAGTVNPNALALLERQNFDVSGLRSKSWDEFAAPGAPEMDFVITVCDRAAGEMCPVWPGQPITAHWSFRDPAAFVGSDAATRIEFAEVFREIDVRVSLFVSLPMASLDRLALQRRVREIGGKPAESA